jgi:hypothetical protein
MPSSEVVEWDRERPDVLALVAGQLIGIEVTVISEAVPRQSTPPQQWWNAAKRLVGQSQAVFDSARFPRLVVRFGFAPSWKTPRKTEAQRFASELAEMAQRYAAELSSSISDDEPITVRDPHPSISWAYFALAGEGSEGHWAPSFAQSVQPATGDDIRATVARKESEIVEYRLAAPQIWLAIDCELSGQEISLDVPQGRVTVHSDFDRVFCSVFGLWQWTEMEVVKPVRRPIPEQH